MSAGQKSGHRIVQGDIAGSDHVGQQQAGEGFGNRTDFKYRVAVSHSTVHAPGRAVRNDPETMPVDQPHDDADAIALDVDAVGQEFVDVCVARGWPRP